MALLGPGLSDISFEDYYVKKLGLTKDVKRVALYHQKFKEVGVISKKDLADLAKIAKYPWELHMEKQFAIAVAREKEPRIVKIVGFLAYGTILLQEVGKPSVYLLANFKEVTSVLDAHG